YEYVSLITARDDHHRGLVRFSFRATPLGASAAAARSAVLRATQQARRFRWPNGNSSDQRPHLGRNDKSSKRIGACRSDRDSRLIKFGASDRRHYYNQRSRRSGGRDSFAD